MPLNIKIKTSNESAFSIDLQESDSVATLKQKIREYYASSGQQVESSDQRLIFAGKVLKDDDSIEVYKLKDGNTVHLVRGNKPKAASPASTAPPVEAPVATQQLPPLNQFTGGPMGGMGMPGMGMPGMGGYPGTAGGMPNMQEMLNNPAMMQMMTQMMSNPQMLDSMIASNPPLAQLMTPQVRQQLASPQFQQMLQNPQMLQQMMQMQQQMQASGMSPFGGMGAGTNPLNNIYGAPPTGANPFLGLGAPGAAAAPATPAVAPEEMYRTQLQQLQDMGFFSKAENIRALQLSGGNVEGAVEILFSRPAGTF